jgi:PH (Pleckstrin Homology) domain-containing protein
VQQRQYRIPTRLSAFFAVVGAFVAVIGVIVVPAAASQLQQGGVSGVVVGSFLILTGALFITAALRPATLTVDDGGLHLRTLTRARVIPWSLVRSFRARPGGRGWWFVWVELGTSKKVVLPGAQGNRDRAERIAAELMVAHRQHLAERSETT